MPVKRGATQAQHLGQPLLPEHGEQTGPPRNTLYDTRVQALGEQMAQKRSLDFEMRRQHLDSKKRASELFDTIMRGVTSPGDALKAEPFQSAFQYKGRMLREASVLHMALWMESTLKTKYAGLVSKLVEARVDLQQKAVYESEGGKSKTSLNAIVVASGLGQIELLDALSKDIKKEDLKQLLNREDNAVKDQQYFYCPLHDACFLGRSQAVVWLINKGADAEKTNSKQTTGLHMFVAAGAFEGTNSDIEDALKALVASGSPLHSTGPDASGRLMLTPLHVATQHKANFPKKLIYLLSPAFHAIRTHSRSDGSGLSIIDDLLLLAQRSPKAADELANEIFKVSPQRRSYARGKLLQDVQHDPDAVLKLAGVMCAAPKTAAEILAVLTLPPKIQDPSKYPLRNVTSLVSWKDLGKATNMRGAYSADALRGRNGILEPAWFYDAVDDTHPKWHDEFIPFAQDANNRQKMYDVQTSVVMVPNLLTVDMMQALANVQEILIFQRLAITGMVTCLWNTLAVNVNSLEIFFLAIFEMLPLLGWGLSVTKDGRLFDRLWRKPPDENRDLSYNSPATVPFVWSLLAGVWLKALVQFIFWDAAHIYRRSVETPHTKVSHKNAGIWTFRQLLDLENVPFNSLKLFLLGKLMFDTAGFLGCEDEKGRNYQTICFGTQAWLAANISLCVAQMIYALRSLAACGPRVLAIVKSLASGAMIEMMFIMAFSFVSFTWVMASLQRQHSMGWETMYLYRGLFFGDGDGLDRMGINSDPGAAADEGDEQQHPFATCYGVIFTIIFYIIFMNLTIAVYSDEYTAQQKRAPLVFLRTRANLMAKMMLKYHTLGWALPCPSRFKTWIGFFVLWLVSIYAAVEETCYTFCFLSAFFFTMWQIYLFVWIAHDKFSPHDSRLRRTGVDCRVLRVGFVSNKMLELRVKITCQGENEQEGQKKWWGEMKKSTLGVDTPMFCGFRRAGIHARSPAVVDDQVVDGAAAQGRYYEATLGFVLKTNHHTRPLTFSFTTPTGEHGSVQFLVPRFMWICHRDDFNESRYIADGFFAAGCKGGDKLNASTQTDPTE